MKRINAILLTVLLLGMLTACDQNVGRHADGIIKADKATFEIGKTHSSFEGMNIQIANAIWDDEEIKLDVNWINKTGYDVVYGSSYDKMLCQTGCCIGQHRNRPVPAVPHACPVR